MAKHRSQSVEFKCQVAQEFLAGETLHGLANRHSLSRNLIRVWVQKYEVGALDDARRPPTSSSNTSADRRPRTARRKAGFGVGAFKRESSKRSPAEKRAYIRDCRPANPSVVEGCRLMGISRSAYYATRVPPSDDTAIFEAIAGVCEEFECYGLAARSGRSPAVGTDRQS